MANSLEELIYTQKYTRQDFVLLLRQLLPYGPIWRIPLPDENPIRAISIVSGEDFGRVTVTTGNSVVTPNGIPSLENLGIPELLSFTLYINSIGSEEFFGLCNINLLITVEDIESEEVFGNPSIAVA